MQLNRFTDYGLRLLTYLAVLPAEQKTSIDEVSALYGLSRNHVNKIVHLLGKAGVIATKRGKGGGFSLAKPAEQINIAEMVLLLENSMQIINCQTPQCRIATLCQLNGIFNEAMAAFITSLQKYTLADLIAVNRAALIDVLMIEA